MGGGAGGRAALGEVGRRICRQAQGWVSCLLPVCLALLGPGAAAGLGRLWGAARASVGAPCSPRVPLPESRRSCGAVAAASTWQSAERRERGKRRKPTFRREPEKAAGLRGKDGPLRSPKRGGGGWVLPGGHIPDVPLRSLLLPEGPGAAAARAGSRRASDVVSASKRSRIFLNR